MSVTGKLSIGLAAGLCAGAILVTKTFLREPAREAGAHGGARDPIELKTPFGDRTRDAARAKKPEASFARDLFHALVVAAAEPEPERREALLREVLREWGATDPRGAIQWARKQGLIDFTQALTSVFQGAVRDPEGAVRLAQISSEQDPEHARDYGTSLVAALGNSGDFRRAAAFAAESAESTRLDLLTAACSAWADKAPREALDFAARLPPATHRDAFNAIISRWTITDAKSVVDYALTLDSTESRTFALSVALRAWSASDAAEAAEWVNRLPPAPELDLATAAIASHPETLGDPAVALSLAESITDRSLKMRILTTVLNRWATTDAALARSYADALADLSPEERLNVRSAFAPDFEPVSFLP